MCTEAGMYALRERRVHVTQEDFEMAVAKVMQKDSEKNMSIKKLWKWSTYLYFFLIAFQITRSFFLVSKSLSFLFFQTKRCASCFLSG